MAVQITNNAVTTLAASITNSATSITLAAGTGSLFPTLGVGDWFWGTLYNATNQLEVVKVTARTGDALTVIRGQDGTTAIAYSAGDGFDLRITAATFSNFVKDTTLTTTLATIAGTYESLASKSNDIGLSADSATLYPTQHATKSYVDTKILGNALNNFLVADATLDAHAVSYKQLVATAFPSGTRLVFQQTAAPTGWTKDINAALNDTALRFVTGTVGTGGSNAFSAALVNANNTGSHVLTVDEIPSHAHSYTERTGFAYAQSGGGQYGYPSTSTSGYTGGGQGHTHVSTIGVKYNDVIVCYKN